MKNENINKRLDINNALQLFMGQIYESMEENDLDITRSQFKPHEPIPEYSDEVSHILLPGPTNLVSMIWTGTLAENTGTEDLAQHLRFVVAFDN
jgi:hypothetical protein